MVMLDILQGVRPKKPVFATTHGYTKELWQMTMCCWEEDPCSRPTVDHVLDALKSAAEQRESQQEEAVGLSPWDNWSPTLLEESDSSTVPEHEDEPATTTASVSPKSPQPSGIKTPLQAPGSLALTPTPLDLVPSIAKDKVSPNPAPSTSELVKPAPVSPPKRGEERKPTPITSKKEESKGEELLTPTWKKGETRPALPAPRLSGRIPDPRPTPDEVVDRLLDRAKLPLGEGEVRKVVEVVEKVSKMRLLATYG